MSARAGSSSTCRKRTWGCTRPWRLAGMGCRPGLTTVSFYCDDLQATVAELESRGVEFDGDVVDAGFGLMTHFRMPGGVRVMLYQLPLPQGRRLKPKWNFPSLRAMQRASIRTGPATTVAPKSENFAPGEHRREARAALAVRRGAPSSRRLRSPGGGSRGPPGSTRHPRFQSVAERPLSSMSEGAVTDSTYARRCRFGSEERTCFSTSAIPW